MSDVDVAVSTAIGPAHWLLACTSNQLQSDRPLGVELHGRRYVLFRSANGITAFNDTCPHRFARLSQGQVADGMVVCPYHGMRFNHEGRCSAVPSLAPGQNLPKHKMPVFQCYEDEGFVWMFSAPDTEVSPPTYWPAVGSEYDSILIVTDFNSTPELLIENFVDCSHTNFVHAGDFRGEPVNPVQAHIIEKPSGVLIRTTGEKKQDSVLSKLLIGSQADIEHTDELILPHTVRVDYRFKQQHFITASVSQAIDAKTTRVYTRVFFRKTWKRLFLRWVLRRMTIKILAQDRLIVEPQAQNARDPANRAQITVAADAPGIRVRRAYRAYYAGSWSGAATLNVDYRL